MPAIQADDIADTLIISLNDLGRLKFTDLSSDYQNTIALKRIFRKKKMTFDSGPEIQFNFMHRTSDSARHVGLAYQNTVDIPNLMGTGKMPWRHTTWNWALERRLVQMNSGKAKIIDLAQTQRIASFGGAIILFERTLWRCPTLAEFNDTHPVGIPYFVVKSSTDALTDTTNKGFNGGLPSDHTTVANVNLTTYPRYKNYADIYVDVNKNDLIRRMRRAQKRITFKPLVDETPVYNLGDDYGIYTTISVLSTMEELLEQQNDNLGNDVASKDGSVMFLRTPVQWVVQLDEDTTDPVYMLNWGELFAMGLSGEWMKEQHFKPESHQPTVTSTVTDCTWNMHCRDRRRQAVLATGTGMPA